MSGEIGSGPEGAPSVGVRPFGTTVGHACQRARAVQEYVLRSSTGLEVWVISYGATLRRVRLPAADANPVDIALWLDDLDAYEDRSRNHHLGATVGRFANRIGGATFDLDGLEHRLVANEGRNCIHGGPIGFDRYVWETARVHPERGSKPLASDGVEASVRFEMTSEADDQGFPGRLQVSVTYEVERDCLRIGYEATTDAATVVNLTNHAYWNLADAGRDVEPRADGRGHELRVDASHFLPVDDQQVPTGEIATVEGTRFDFRRRRLVATDYDNCLVLDKEDTAAATQPTDAPGRDTTPPLRFAAEMVDRRSGRAMELWTNQPAVQLYTAQHLSEPFAPYAALCVEAQGFPDAPNHPNFPSAVLLAGEVYSRVIEHRFSRS